jgi:hypothetical protein
MHAHNQSNTAAHYLVAGERISPPLERALLNCSPYIRDWIGKERD